MKENVMIFEKGILGIDFEKIAKISLIIGVGFIAYNFIK